MKGEGWSLLMTAGGKDADTERTGKYLQRVMSKDYPFPHRLLLPYTRH